jgi:hypothetical protein
MIPYFPSPPARINEKLELPIGARKTILLFKINQLALRPDDFTCQGEH